MFFVLTYKFWGNAQSSILCRLRVPIEPLTMFFDLIWQAFMAFCASAIFKESLLGVLNTLYGTGGSLVSSTFSAKASGAAASGISKILPSNFTKAEGLPSSLPSASICPAPAYWPLLPERLIPSCGQQRSACSIRLCHCRLPASCIASDCLHSEWRKPSACKENIGNVLSTSAGPGFLARSASLPSAGLEASPRIAVSPAHDGLLVEKALRWQ